METIDSQFNTLRGLSYTGALEDMLLAYYNDQNAATDTCLNDAQYKFLINQGQSGSLPDMLFTQDSVFV